MSFNILQYTDLRMCIKPAQKQLDFVSSHLETAGWEDKLGTSPFSQKRGWGLYQLRLLETRGRDSGRGVGAEHMSRVRRAWSSPAGRNLWWKFTRWDALVNRFQYHSFLFRKRIHFFHMLFLKACIKRDFLNFKTLLIFILLPCLLILWANNLLHPKMQIVLDIQH